MNTPLRFWRPARALACAAAMALPAVPGAHTAAQTFPARPIRLVVPFAPGGSTDISTRLLASEMTGNIGQTVLVENKPGNAGGIGIDAVAKAEPDGYTLGISGVGPTILL